MVLIILAMCSSNRIADMFRKNDCRCKNHHGISPTSFQIGALDKFVVAIINDRFATPPPGTAACHASEISDQMAEGSRT